jgi:hypothetical protein
MWPITMTTDIPPVGAPSPSAYVTPKHPHQERRQPSPKKHHDPDHEQETEHHDGIDCYT